MMCENLSDLQERILESFRGNPEGDMLLTNFDGGVALQGADGQSLYQGNVLDAPWDNALRGLVSDRQFLALRLEGPDGVRYFCLTAVGRGWLNRR